MVAINASRRGGFKEGRRGGVRWAEGTVKLLERGRDKARNAGQAHGRSRHAGNAGHLGPGLEGAGSGGSILGGREVIAAEVEEVVDLVVGGEEALRVSG